MAKKSKGREQSLKKSRSFAETLANDPKLASLRSECADRPLADRRRAAEWAYDESVAEQLFARAAARLPGGGFSLPAWPPGFTALAIDPEFGPALLTVGAYEFARGRPATESAQIELPFRTPPGPGDTNEGPHEPSGCGRTICLLPGRRSVIPGRS